MHSYIKSQLQKKQVQAALVTSRCFRSHGLFVNKNRSSSNGSPWPAMNKLRPIREAGYSRPV